MPKLLSLNAKGLNHPAKRASFWRTARNLSDIICIQETPFKNPAEPHCTNKNFTHVYQASGPTKKNGIIIAIKNTIAFTLHNNIIDVEGRYLTLDCTLHNTTYTIVNVYAPNTKQIRFLSKLMKKKQIPSRSPYYVRWFLILYQTVL